MPHKPSPPKDSSKALFQGPCTFLTSVVKIEDLPLTNLPEIAFVGRSNVGKSSLINAVCNRKGLAKTSQVPGKTKMLNFFLISETFYLVDLPGYGYAKAAKGEIEAWNYLIYLYLKGRAPLKMVFLLMDSRHGTKKNDLEFMAFLDEMAVPYQVVLTKTDKISETKASSLIEETQKLLTSHPAAYPEVLATSSEKKQGIVPLQDRIFELISM